jgi:hypothetical protein
LKRKKETKHRGYIQKLQKTKWNFGQQEAEWANCYSGLTWLFTGRTSLRTWRWWPAWFWRSSNKLDKFLDHFGKDDRSQPGESPSGILNSCCGLHRSMLTPGCRRSTSCNSLLSVGMWYGFVPISSSQDSLEQTWEDLSS